MNSKRTILKSQLYYYDHNCDVNITEYSACYKNSDGNFYVQYLPTSEKPAQILAIFQHDIHTNFLPSELFSLSSIEDVDAQCKKATFIATSGNGMQSYYYDGFVVPEVILVSAIVYDEQLFTVTH